MKSIILLVLLPILTVQWWDVGHMLTAAIAETRLNQLSPYTSVRFRDLVASINGLVDNRTRTFIESAVWPDDLKEKQYNMELWNDQHFIDKPFVEDGVFPVINMTASVASSVEIINNAVKVLSSNINKTTAEKAMFSRYLVHVVGDIHQPLHSVSLFNSTYPSGDRGGNSLKITLLNGTTQNLHSFWDSGAFRIQNDSWFIVRPMSLANQTALKQVANSYIKAYGASIEKLAQDVNPNTWAMESYRYAQNTTYPHMFTSSAISQAYSDLAYETSKKRITLAGYRIANLVIKIYEKISLDENESDGNQQESISEKQSKDSEEQIIVIEEEVEIFDKRKKPLILIDE